ncbi:hypothetical protein BH11ACT4_BH11ACT4_12760 [soil metagenome]
MDAAVAQALALTPASSAADRAVEITTMGRVSGLPRRLDIRLYRVADKNYLCESPGRDPAWYEDVVEHPHFTLHLRNGVVADIRAKAVPITEEAERARVLEAIVADLNQPSNPCGIIQPTALDAWLEGSVLAEVRFDES